MIDISIEVIPTVNGYRLSPTTARVESNRFLEELVRNETVELRERVTAVRLELVSAREEIKQLTEELSEARDVLSRRRRLWFRWSR